MTSSKNKRHQQEASSRAGVQCPICNEEAEKKYHPFCSKKCADVDLNRWLNGVYAIPAVEDDEDPGAALAAETESKPLLH